MMDMKNATQGAPSHGLIDMIFGNTSVKEGETEPPESGGGDGDDPIAAIVQALEKQGKKIDEAQAEIAWGGDMDANGNKLPADWMGVSVSLQASDGLPAQKTDSKKPGESIDPALMEIAGGNMALAMLMQKMNPSPETMKAIREGDGGAVLKMIEGRKAELKEQMPALGKMEKAIDREGLEKVVGTASLAELVAKYEAEYSTPNKMRKGASTEDFLAAKGLKVGPAKDSGEDGLSGFAAFSPAAAKNLSGGANAAHIAASATAAGGPAGAVTAKSIKDSLMHASGNSKDIVDGVRMGGDAGQTTAVNVTMAAGAGIAMTAGVEKAGDGKAFFSTMNMDTSGTDGSRANFVPRMAQNISFFAKQGGGEITMKIHPKELGEVQLKIATNGQNVHVHMIAQNEDVAKILRASSNDLSSALSSQKLQLAGMDISVQASSSGHESGFANLNGNSSSAQNFSQNSSSGGEGRFQDNLSGGGREQPQRQAQQVPKDTGSILNSAPKKNNNGNIDLKA